MVHQLRSASSSLTIGAIWVPYSSMACMRFWCRRGGPCCHQTSIHIEVYSCVMTRTNIDLDDELVSAVMRRYRLTSKKSAVDFALRQLVVTPMTRDEVLAMRGSGIEVSNDEIEGDWTNDR